jgi:dTDP-4-amino-4,6-dideoxygalactose transaminase
MHLRHGGQKKHEHLLEGLNSRLDGLQAAVLNEKLKKIDYWDKKREIIAREYLKSLSNINEIELPVKKIKSKTHGFHQFVIKAKNRDKLKKFLFSKKISTLVHYPKILPFVPAYRYQKNKKKNFVNSLKNQKLILSLPIYPELKIKEVKYISQMIRKFYKF